MTETVHEALTQQGISYHRLRVLIEDKRGIHSRVGNKRPCADR